MPADPVTGEIRNHRGDPAARTYNENGEKAKKKVAVRSGSSPQAVTTGSGLA
ncbi:MULTISPECIES: hypothetical protein [Streptomyces]|uniref:hypothetical protein n=1 Tax=Streptomyces TaxID=1883 RepID=UPI0019237A0A|nr:MULTISPECIES: hypothetical protein [Streptomyces]MCX5305521.1 hypothetical protein [Streptomyces sp. NBC_00160]